jgi:2-polyprenyl-3-methyl-5-hydroxy-6-metoxy-1,4-benzoquinol methylase
VIMGLGNDLTAHRQNPTHGSLYSCEPRLSREHVYRNSGNMPLLGMLDLRPNDTVLDVGCGCGDNASILAKLGCTAHGITLSRVEFASAVQACSKVWVHDLDNGLPQEVAGPYDLILLSHVLEHLRRPEALLVDLRRIIRPGGKIAVALPNILNWYQRLLFLSGRFEYEDEGIMDTTHLRFYTFSTGRKMLEACGFSIVRAKAAGSILPWGSLRQVVPSLLSTVDDFFCRIRPGLFGRQLLYVARLQKE